MDGVVEIITGRERRRRWSVEEKLRIAAETLRSRCPGECGRGSERLCDSLVLLHGGGRREKGF